MAKFNTFNQILDGHDALSDNGAVDWARGIVWSEIETSEQDIECSRYVDSVDGVDVFYDFKGAYYFFVEAEGEV